MGNLAFGAIDGNLTDFFLFCVHEQFHHIDGKSMMLTSNNLTALMVYRLWKKVSPPLDHHRGDFHLQFTLCPKLTGGNMNAETKLRKQLLLEWEVLGHNNSSICFV